MGGEGRKRKGRGRKEEEGEGRERRKGKEGEGAGKREGNKWKDKSGQKACVGTKGEGRCMGNKFLTSEYSKCPFLVCRQTAHLYSYNSCTCSSIVTYTHLICFYSIFTTYTFYLKICMVLDGVPHPPVGDWG